jgi:hypothetical protein
VVCVSFRNFGLSQNGLLIIRSNRNSTSPSLPSGSVQSLLERAESDVLILYDCCHSAASRTGPFDRINIGVKEVIAACGYESVAAEVDQHSFTKALIQSLAEFSQGLPFSVGELHTRVLDRLKCWAPCLAQDEEERFVRHSNGRLAYEHQPRKTPVYSIICETAPRRSIVLSPFKPSELPPNHCQQAGQVEQAANGNYPVKRKKNTSDDLERKRKQSHWYLSPFV